MEKFTETGVFNLNGTNINYTITNNYFDSEMFPTAHIEFTSVIEKKPNAISETGYRSNFLGIVKENVSNEIQNNHQDIIKEAVYGLVEENGNQVRNFCFSQLEELNHERVIQTALF